MSDTLLKKRKNLAVTKRSSIVMMNTTKECFAHSPPA